VEIIAIAAVGLAAWVILGKPNPLGSAGSAPTQTPAPPVPNAFRVGAVNPGISGGYRLVAPFTSINGAATAFTPTALPSTIPPPPVLAPPPAWRGGIAGSVGSGGNPLGSGFRTGVTSGTATTVVPTSPLQTLPRTSVLF